MKRGGGRGGQSLGKEKEYGKGRGVKGKRGRGGRKEDHKGDQPN